MEFPSVLAKHGRFAHLARLVAVLGWLLVVFAIIPLTMGGRGEGHTLLVAGGVMVAAGVVLVVLGRMRRGTLPPPASGA